MSGKIMRVSANGGCLGIIIVFMCPSLCINSPGRSRYSFLCFTLFKTYCVLRNIHTYIIIISVLLHKIHLIRLELQVHLGFTWYSGIAEHIGIAFYCYKGKNTGCHSSISKSMSANSNWHFTTFIWGYRCSKVRAFCRSKSFLCAKMQNPMIKREEETVLESISLGASQRLLQIQPCVHMTGLLS